ncbi:MAG: hypothetical protein KJ000_10020 [Pirellulaceae bacterium]|nr:hypothetical protein [Pirellulaceae bacterium]
MAQRGGVLVGSPITTVCCSAGLATSPWRCRPVADTSPGMGHHRTIGTLGGFGHLGTIGTFCGLLWSRERFGCLFTTGCPLATDDPR